MTVSSQTNNETFNGNGVTTIWDLPFRFFDNADITAYLNDPIAQTSTPLVLGTDYTLTGAGLPEQFGAAPGKITTTAAVVTGKQLYVERVMAIEQLTDIINQGRFFPEVHEDVFDKQTMLLQQSVTGLGRALTRPIGKNYYDALGYRIANLADPINPQDAATKQWAANYIDSVSGLVNTTVGIAYDGGTLFDYLRFGVARTVDSIAALKALSSTRNQRAFVLGYYAARDGGGGIYAIDPSDTTTPGNGGTIIVATDGARWKMVPLGAISVLQFGVKADGVTDGSSAVNLSLTALGYAFVPAHAGTYLFGGITLGTGQRLYSDGKANVKIPAAASYGVRVTAFAGGSVQLQGQYAELYGFNFDASLCPTSTTAVRFGTSSGTVFGFRGHNLMFSNCGEAVGDEFHATNFVVDAFFEDCTCIFTRERQVYLRRSRGFITFRDFRIDHTYNTGQVTWGGARFDDLIGLELEKFDIVGPTIPTATYQPTAVGLTIVGAAGSASVWLRRLLIDNTRGPGLSITGVHNVFGVDTCIFQNLGAAMELVNVSKSLFTNTKLVGGIGLTGAPASANGLSMNGCTSVTFEGLEAEAHTGDGITQVSCTDCTISGGYSNGNTGWGRREVTVGIRNLISEMRMISNAAGSNLQIGAQSASADWWANGGTFLPSTIGAISVP